MHPVVNGRTVLVKHDTHVRDSSAYPSNTWHDPPNLLHRVWSGFCSTQQLRVNCKVANSADSYLNTEHRTHLYYNKAVTAARFPSVKKGAKVIKRAWMKKLEIVYLLHKESSCKLHIKKLAML